MNLGCIKFSMQSLEVWYKPVLNAEYRKSQNLMSLATAKSLSLEWLEEGRKNPFLTDMRED